jgi:hypothetical protein
VVHCVDQGVSAITLNATFTGLKFFFEATLGQAELMAKMHPVRVARTLPIILSREEVSRLIRQGSRYRTANGLVSSVEPMTPETGMMYLRSSIRGRVVHWSLFQN